MRGSQRDRVRLTERTSKRRGYYARYDDVTALGKLANRNKLFKTLTVDSIRQ